MEKGWSHSVLFLYILSCFAYNNHYLFKNGGDITLIKMNQKIRFLITVTVTTVAVYLAMKYLLPLIIPFLIAYMIAIIISPLVSWLHVKLKIKRGLAAGIIILLFFALMALTGNLVVRKFMDQLQFLLEKWSYYQEYFHCKLDSVCCNMEMKFGLQDGTILNVVYDNLDYFLNNGKSRIISLLMSFSFPLFVDMIKIVGITIIIGVMAVLCAKDMELIKIWKDNFLFSKELKLITTKLSIVGIAFLKAQFIIMIMTMVVSVIGLKFLGNRYSLLLGITIGLLDAFPLIGTGLIYIPWSVFYMINGDFTKAAMIFTIYLICYLVREYLEPRLVGEKAGIPPLISIISMYIGYQLFGIIGFIIGPIGYIIIYEVIKETDSKIG